MPAVSVLIPCYNAAHTLPEALDSLSRQTFLDFEIVAVNDGSTNSTGDVLDTWAVSKSRLRVLHQPHGGIISALNAGLKACRAPLIARMDADDRSHAERLGRQFTFMEQYPSVAVVGCRVVGFPLDQVYGGFQVYLEWINSLIIDADIRREIFVESPLVHPSVMFRREAVSGYEDHGWAEDYDLWLRLYLAGAQFAKLPEVLLEWRETPARLTRTDDRYSLENFLQAKAFYMMKGPLAGSDAVIVWGAGMIGRRLSKHLLHHGVPIVAFVDVDPRKIGRTRRGQPILPPEALLEWFRRYQNPAVLAAVGTRGARQLIRQRLNAFGLIEGQNWWSVA